MKGKSKQKRRKTKKRILWIAIIIMEIAIDITVISMAGMLNKKKEWKTPTELLVQYMNCIPVQEYKKMYDMLYIKESGISQQDFIKRNSAIYEGIGMQNMTIEILAYHEEEMTVVYQTSFDTVAGNISFKNKALFIENGYQLVWDDSLIFPNLTSVDKVRVSTIQANRGEILDRNGQVLAGKGLASSVGIVPGKLENRKKAVKRVARLLEMKPKVIKKKLSARWVKDDSFVPMKTIPKVEEIELIRVNQDKEVLQEKERQERLLEIPGVMISDIEIRKYPLGKAAAHLIGYVLTMPSKNIQ